MKSFTTVFCLAVAFAAAGQLHVSTPALSLILDAEQGTPLEYVYFGPRLSDADIPQVFAAETHSPAYPAYGVESSIPYALAVTHADGSLASDLRVESTSQSTDTDGAVTTRIRLRDTIYPFYVDVCYLTYPDCDVIETWTEISHGEATPVRLTEYPSLFLPVRRGNVWLSHISGAWGNEGQLNAEPLGPGVKSIRNRDGIRNSQASHAEIMLSLDGKPDERTGRTIGAALCYSGNFDISLNTDLSDRHKLIMGIDPANASYTLAPGEVFTTPTAAISWSDRGTSGVSRNFHRWGRAHRISHPSTPRPILLNSWEGIYFDVNKPVVEKMMQDIADMGGELFVLDDGWFGSKYPRDNDRQGLGDWTVDRRKLPEGIGALVKSADRKGLRFGLWIEPEMVNRYSELYEAHPDWIIKANGRDPIYGRGGTQLVLDLGNPEVQEHVFSVFDRVMTENPDISYIKWDSNMNLKNPGSQYLASDRQSHLLIEWHRGLEKVLKRLREKYPDVIIQACGAGGGRVNWGIMPYFDEFWVSDNTDPLQRIYIQWGTSYFFPAMAMAQHISASPCHATHRATPIKYRVDVAMSGRLGLELQPSQMTPYEREFCRNAIEAYKEIRPTVQFGDQYRLHSPYDGDGVAALMYVDEPRDHAVFFWYKTEDFHNHHYPRVTMDGLDPDKIYRVTELNAIDATPLPYEGKTFSGRYLMDAGLDLPYRHYPADISLMSDYSSRVLRLDAIN